MVAGILHIPSSLLGGRRQPKRVHWNNADSAGTDGTEVLPLFTVPSTDDPEASTSASGAHDGEDDDDNDEEHPKGITVAWSHKHKRSRGLPRPPLLSANVLQARLIVVILTIFIPTLISIAYFVNKERELSRPWKPDVDTILFSQKPLPPPLQRTRISNYTLPLRTKGRDIVDARDRRFKLLSVNWYGASDELFVPGGLDVQHRDVIAKTIKSLGFNSVRLPYADELVSKNPIIEPHLVLANPDLAGLHALDVLEATTAALTDAGLAVIINNHITKATWCCGANPCDAGWANDHLGSMCRVRQTEEQWIQNWEAVMGRFVHNPLVIGADLRNEVRGLWGTMPWSKWAAAAERCGNRLLKMNPDLLIVVEGTESANDLSGAKKRPVELEVDNRLVYSVHGYKWSGWGSWQGRFSQRKYKPFRKTMRHSWGYLLEDDIAPVWFGELGAPHGATKGDHNYWKNLWKYLAKVDADFGYWAINPSKPRAHGEGAEPEPYSLVQDDWVTPIVDYRLKDMMEAMRRE